MELSENSVTVLAGKVNILSAKGSWYRVEGESLEICYRFPIVYSHFFKSANYQTLLKSKVKKKRRGFYLIFKYEPFSIYACCVLTHVYSCESLNYSPPGPPVHVISQTRILEWVAISYSRGSSRTRDQTCVSLTSCTGRQIRHHGARLEAPSTYTVHHFQFTNLYKIYLWGNVAFCIKSFLHARVRDASIHTLIH